MREPAAGLYTPKLLTVTVPPGARVVSPFPEAGAFNLKEPNPLMLPEAPTVVEQLEEVVKNSLNPLLESPSSSTKAIALLRMGDFLRAKQSFKTATTVLNVSPTGDDIDLDSLIVHCSDDVCAYVLE